MRPLITGGWHVTSIVEHKPGESCRNMAANIPNVADVVMETRGRKKKKGDRVKGSRGIGQAGVLALLGEYGAPVMEGLKSDGLRLWMKAQYGVTVGPKTAQRVLKRYRDNPRCVNLDKRFSLLRDYEVEVCNPLTMSLCRVALNMRSSIHNTYSYPAT